MKWALKYLAVTLAAAAMVVGLASWAIGSSPSTDWNRISTTNVGTGNFCFAVPEAHGEGGVVLAPAQPETCFPTLAELQTYLADHGMQQP